MRKRSKHSTASMSFSRASAAGDNWTTVAPTEAPVGTTWNNSGADIAAFGTTDSASAFTATIGMTSPTTSAAISAAGLAFLNDGVTLKSAGTVAAPVGTLTLTGNSPTITVGSLAANATARMNVALAGSPSNGLIVQTGATGAFTGRLIMGETGSAANFANNMSGGITVKERTILEGVVRTDSNNPFGSNAITLEAGATLEINGTANSNNGISGRVFSTTGTAFSSRVDYSGTATGVSLPTTVMSSTGVLGSSELSVSSTATLIAGQGGFRNGHS
jgi:hypothetical protein